MRTTNSHGNAAPNLKSINVECNLLDTWLAERNALQRSLVKRLTVMGVALAVLLASAPPLWVAVKAAEQRDAAASRARGKLEKEMAAWDAKKKAADPVVAGQQMLRKSSDKVRLIVGWTVDTLNLAPKDVVIETCRTEVLGGELTIHVRADAVSADSAQTYVDRAGKDPRVASCLLASSRSSAALGPHGVAFEFVRKVEVGS